MLIEARFHAPAPRDFKELGRQAYLLAELVCDGAPKGASVDAGRCREGVVLLDVKAAVREPPQAFGPYFAVRKVSA